MSSPVALLVEDEPQIRRFLRTALEAEGWTVHETGTQRQGIIDAGTRKPDLLVVDLGLPDGDGTVLIREVRAWSAVPATSGRRVWSSAPRWFRRSLNTGAAAHRSSRGAGSPGRTSSDDASSRATAACR